MPILFYDSQLKYYGSVVIFKCLLKDLKILETSGIDVCYNDQTINLKDTTSMICQDNLAENGTSGFIESFGCNMSFKYVKNTI